MERAVLIIGGSGDIGFEMGVNFLNKGYNVILHYNHLSDRIVQLEHQIKDKNKLKLVNLNLYTTDFNTLVFHNITDIIFCAGNSCFKNIFECTLDDMQEQFALQLFSPFEIIKLYVNNNISLKSIVFISSKAGLDLNSSSCCYGLAKASMIALSKMLSKEMIKRGTKVNCIAPGLCDNKMGLDVCSNKNVNLEDEKNKRIDKQLVSMSELASVCYYLVEGSDMHINGQVIEISSEIIDGK